MSYSSVYAVILNYNSAQDSCELYKQLKEYYPEIGIVVVDNKANDEDRKALVNYIPSDQLILIDDNLGYAGGNNVGTKWAIEKGAEYIWILNPDIRVEATALHILLDSMESDDQIAVIGPRICHRNDEDKIYSDGGIIDSKTLATSHINSNINVKDVFDDQNLLSVDYVDGSSMLLRVETLNSIGLMHEFFFLYFEETEWCFRARNQGWKLIVNTEARAYQTRSDKNVNYHYYTSRNRIILGRLISENKMIIFRQEIKNILFGFLHSITKGNPKFKDSTAKFRGFIHGLTFKFDKINTDT